MFWRVHARQLRRSGRLTNVPLRLNLPRRRLPNLGQNPKSINHPRSDQNTIRLLNLPHLRPSCRLPGSRMNHLYQKKRVLSLLGRLLYALMPAKVPKLPSSKFRLSIARRELLLLQPSFLKTLTQTLGVVLLHRLLLSSCSIKSLLTCPCYLRCVCHTRYAISYFLL